MKELWQKNKVLIVLGFILLVCLIAILIVTFSFFFGGNKNEYGDRLKDIDKYQITETIKNDYISSLENDKSVSSVKFNTKGRIIYITINYFSDTYL